MIVVTFVLLILPLAVMVLVDLAVTEERAGERCPACMEFGRHTAWCWRGDGAAA